MSLLKLIIIVLDLIVIAFCLWSIRRAIQERSIQQQLKGGSLIDADVVRKRVGTVGPRNAAYYVTYAFEYGSSHKSYSNEQIISEQYYKNLGSQIKVTFLKDNPEISRVASDPDRDAAAATTFVAVYSVGMVILAAVISAIVLFKTA